MATKASSSTARSFPHVRIGDDVVAQERLLREHFSVERLALMPIDEDLLFPVRDCLPEQALIKGSELRVIEDIQGHLALFGVAPTYMPQIDQHLSELLATQV